MPMIDIYYEHIEEASFLYDQRENVFSDPEGDLEYQHELEERLEAHIDGLELGGEHSRPILVQYLDSDDEGEFFAALFSLLRITRDDPAEFLDFIENNPIPSQRSLVQVLRGFDSPFVTQRLASWLGSESSTLRGVAAYLLGDQRNSSLLASLEALLNDSDVSVNNAALHALNRIAPEKGRQFAYTALLNGKEEPFLLETCFENLYLQQEATLTQLAMQYCTGTFPYHPAAPILLALGKSQDQMTFLQGLIHEAGMNRGIAQAIGFTGRLDMLQQLVPFEKSEECNECLREAAHLVLGTSPPVFDEADEEEEEEESPELFSLSGAIASFCAAGKEQDGRYRIGLSLADKKNSLEIFRNIGAPYRKWLYLESSCDSGKVVVDYDSSARVQYPQINSLITSSS